MKIVKIDRGIYVAMKDETYIATIQKDVEHWHIMVPRNTIINGKPVSASIQILKTKSLREAVDKLKRNIDFIRRLEQGVFGLNFK